MTGACFGFVTGGPEGNLSFFWQAVGASRARANPRASVAHGEAVFRIVNMPPSINAGRKNIRRRLYHNPFHLPPGGRGRQIPNPMVTATWK